MIKHQAMPYRSDVVFDEAAQPDLDEVMQRPASPVCVPVKHEGPIQNHPLPSRLGTAFVHVASTVAEQVLGADRQRSRALLISTDNAFLYSVSRSINGTGTAALWPPLVPLELRNFDAVTVATSTGTASVSIVTENWAD